MKLWDGRFRKSADSLMDEFGNSLSFDKELAEEDIAGSVAWARELGRIGVLSAREVAKIESGLRSVAKEIRTCASDFLPTDEDIHMAVERLLTEKIGEAGGKLHAGRSRNDQVVTDVRLFVKRSLEEIARALDALQRELLARAKKDGGIVFPVYTHLQQAQPALLSHYWLSFFFALDREYGRVTHAIETSDFCPLGSGAAAGSGFPVDRKRLARELGFSAETPNSIDAVGSRDFVLETLAAIASTGITLSRYAEDLIIWSSKEFGFITLDDAWSSGSSMMPQKKNPDSLELIRGKSGRFIGNYTRVAATLKGVGLAYYKDLQEDKEPLFDSVRQIKLALGVFAGVLNTLTVNAGRITQGLDPFLFATDVADYLVRKGLPFRQAHKRVGAIVAYCIDNGIALPDVPLSTLKSFSALFKRDIRSVFSPHHALALRELSGGTGKKSVARQIALAQKRLKEHRRP